MIIWILSSSETPSSNLYHFSGFNGFPSHEYDAPLFQLSREDVMDNAILKNAVLPFEWLYVEEEIGHGKVSAIQIFSCYWYEYIMLLLCNYI